MTEGIVLVTLGIFCIFFNTVAVIAYNVKMRRENERIFITFRGLREPSTAKLKNKKSIIEIRESVDIMNEENIRGALTFDDTVIIQDITPSSL